MLRENPKTRDDDVLLMIELWKKHHPTLMRVTKDGDVGVYLKDIALLPREDHIKRYRATIQNVENKYLPTKWEVAKQRKINEDKWKKALGYRT